MKTRFHPLEKCFLAFCLALSFSLPALAEPTATATLVPDTIRVGDPALLTLTIAHPDSVLPVLPALDRGDAIRLLAPPTLTNSPAPDAPGQTLTHASYRLTSLVVTNDNPVAPTNALITFALAPGAALPDASAALPAPIPFPFANLAVETTLSPAGDTPLQPPVLTPLAWPAPSWRRPLLVDIVIDAVDAERQRELLDLAGLYGLGHVLGFVADRLFRGQLFFTHEMIVVTLSVQDLLVSGKASVV
ncbi:MAG: hypothetical protein J6Y19_05595, partial [Kiritimatiellae bacterium]|nr:hypothetical protein [Kiritimatiellia bacterium]